MSLFYRPRCDFRAITFVYIYIYTAVYIYIYTHTRKTLHRRGTTLRSGEYCVALIWTTHLEIRAHFIVLISTEMPLIKYLSSRAAPRRYSGLIDALQPLTWMQIRRLASSDARCCQCGDCARLLWTFARRSRSQLGRRRANGCPPRCVHARPSLCHIGWSL